MLFLAGMMGLLMAGAFALTPVESQETEAEVEDDALPFENEQQDATQAASDFLDQLVGDDASDDEGATQDPVDAPVFETPDVTPDDPDLFDPTDHVYGQNIGDGLGGNMFHQMFFSDPAILGTEQEDALAGSDGQDWMVGNGADDTLDAGAGDDFLTGDGGDDLLISGEGDDISDGGLGADTLMGDAGDDMLTAGEGNDVIEGGEGDDRIFGQLGQDTLAGGAGDDFIDGTHASTTLSAWSDEDEGDFLDGGAGDDILVLGNGDVATGGAGADDFVSGLYAADVAPLITDFDPLEDELLLAYPAGEDEPELEILTEGEDTSVLLNGEEVARLSGTALSSTASIVMIPLTL